MASAIVTTYPYSQVYSIYKACLIQFVVKVYFEKIVCAENFQGIKFLFIISLSYFSRVILLVNYFNNLLFGITDMLKYTDNTACTASSTTLL